MRKLIFPAVAVLLAACNENGVAREPEILKTFEVDGCQVKYIDPPSLPNFYIARCDNTTTTTWQQQSGKSKTTYATVSVDNADELRRRLAEVEAKEKALAKLSPEERKALGLK